MRDIRARFPAATVQHGDPDEQHVIQVEYGSVADPPSSVCIRVYYKTWHVFAEPLGVFDCCTTLDEFGGITLQLPDGSDPFPDGDTDYTDEDSAATACVEWWLPPGDCAGLSRLAMGLASIAAEHFRAEALARAIAATLRVGFPGARVTLDMAGVFAAFEGDTITVRVALEQIDDAYGIVGIHMFPFDAFDAHRPALGPIEMTTSMDAGQGTCASRFFQYESTEQREDTLGALVDFAVAAARAASRMRGASHLAPPE